MAHYDSVQDILREFPARNNKWMALDSGFSVEISDFNYRQGEILDPWNRPLPELVEFRNNDNDVTHWATVTTVNGFPIRLTIFND